MNVYLPNLRLPSTYQEVEYIQSTGTQYINTMVSMNPMYGIEIQYQLVSFSSWATLFGTRSGPIQRYTARYYETVSDTSIEGFQVQISPDGTTSNYGRVNLKPFNGTDLNVNIIKITNRDVYLNGDLKGSMGTSSYTGTFSNPLFLFATNSDGSAIDTSIIKLFYFKIYDSSGNIIHDFVPCYRKQDGVIGLYDLVNNQFYTNSGTGTFSKGSDVTMAELKNAYIGEYGWRPTANTLFYLPLESDATDHSGRNISTNPSNITYGTLGGVTCAIANGSSSIITFNEILSSGLTEGTVSMYIYKNYEDTSSDDFKNVLYYRVTNMGFVGIDSEYNGGGLNYRRIGGYVANRGKAYITSNLSYRWHHLLFTFNNSVAKYYIDGNKISEQASSTSRVWGYGEGTGWNTRTIFKGNPSANGYWKGGAREIIFEKKMWSDTEVTNYFNNTKSQYGIN